MKIGEKIKDTSGRVGVITEVRENGFFARPADVEYTVDGSATGVPGAKLITVNWWQDEGNGLYRGVWYDARLNSISTIQVECEGNA